MPLPSAALKVYVDLPTVDLALEIFDNDKVEASVDNVFGDLLMVLQFNGLPQKRLKKPRTFNLRNALLETVVMVFVDARLVSDLFR